VNDKTPPTFIVHTEDDKSFIAGSKVYRDALDASKVGMSFSSAPPVATAMVYARTKK
jgi:hypothetical protein